VIGFARMSHFTRCALKLTNREAIRAAIVDMGFPFREAEAGKTVLVRGGCGETRQGVIAVDLGGYDVGILAAKDGTFEVLWPGVSGAAKIGGAEYACTLAQRYQYHNVKIACEENGYALAEEVDEADGSIRLLVRRWSVE
jgi:hypothetical protein